MDLSKQTVLVFDPRDPRFRRKLWVRIATTGGNLHHVFWGRVAGVAALAVLVFWLGLAGAAWGFVKYRRGFAGVSYLDLAFYPLRHEHYRTSLGRHYLSESRAAFARQDFQLGYTLMNAGVARVPDELVARRQLALVDLKFGRPDRALRTLGDGLPLAHGDLDYLRLLFGLLAETNDYARIIALAQELLPATPDRENSHLFVALQAASAHYQMGRLEEAESLVQRWHLENSVEGQILLSRCDWDRGLHDLALLRLEQQLAAFSKRDELYLELVRRQRAAGHPDEARRYALLRQFNDPASPGPRIDLLHCYHAAGDGVAGQRELEAYLTRYGSDLRALQLLAGFAVETAQPALAERVARLAAQQKFPPPYFDLARVQATLAVRDFRAAGDLAEAALGAGKSAPGYAADLFLAERAVAFFGLGDQGRAQSLLSTFLAAPQLTASDALLLARQLTAVDQMTPARQVLARAVQLDPRNQAALTALVRLDAASGDRSALARNLPALLALRKPSRAAMDEILNHLNERSDEPLRAQIREALSRPAPAGPP